LPISGQGRLNTVSCARFYECVAIGTMGDPEGDPLELQQVALAWTSRDWYQIADPPASTTGIYASNACAGMMCVAVGYEGDNSARALLASVWEFAPANPPPG
jgi:hypothetical protein